MSKVNICLLNIMMSIGSIRSSNRLIDTLTLDDGAAAGAISMGVMLILSNCLTKAL
ncbi:MAG: hypothetical protein ACXV9U_17195 [Methylobacter sp.]